MSMDGQIRVKTDKRYARLYNDLKNVAVGDFHELFFVCACLGFKNRKREKLGGGQEDRFWSHTIEPREWACYYAMLLEDSDMDFGALRDDRAVISQVEEYANAGMDILIDSLLSDYLAAAGGEPRLDPTYSRDLPKQFLNYVFEQFDDEPSADG